MSLKEKFQVVLNQRGQFKCPNRAGSVKAVAQTKPNPKPNLTTTPKAPVAAKSKEDKLALIVANLKQRGNSKPRTLKTLTSTVASLFPKDLSDVELIALVQQLQSKGKVIMSVNKVTYAL